MYGIQQYTMSICTTGRTKRVETFNWFMDLWIEGNVHADARTHFTSLMRAHLARQGLFSAQLPPYLSHCEVIASMRRHVPPPSRLSIPLLLCRPNHRDQKPKQK